MTSEQVQRNIDLVLAKQTQFAGNQSGEIRFEFLNLTNTPMWGLPNRDIASNNFGRTTVVGSDNQTGEYGGKGDTRDAGSGERQIRFGLRFQF